MLRRLIGSKDDIIDFIYAYLFAVVIIVGILAMAYVAGLAFSAGRMYGVPATCQCGEDCCYGK